MLPYDIFSILLGFLNIFITLHISTVGHLSVWCWVKYGFCKVLWNTGAKTNYLSFLRRNENKFEKPSLETNQIILKDKSLKTGFLNFGDAFTNESWVFKIRLATQVAACFSRKGSATIIHFGRREGENVTRVNVCIFSKSSPWKTPKECDEIQQDFVCVSLDGVSSMLVLVLKKPD